jgi:splicing factor 3B subunit 1
LGAFLKAVGFIIPLMEPRHAAQYTKTIMPTLIRQFETPEEEMRKIVLKVLKQIISCNGIEPSYIRK